MNIITENIYHREYNLFVYNLYTDIIHYNKENLITIINRYVFLISNI